MPHDVNGELLKVGDTVALLAKITEIQPGEEYCNCTIKPIYAMPPYTSEQAFTIQSINTKQLEKIKVLSA